MNNDERWDEMLQPLSGVRASDGFTSRVLERAKVAKRRRTAVRSTLAAAMIAIVVTSTALSVRREQKQVALEAAVAAEREAIRKELEALKTAEMAAEPVIYVGSADGVDYVLDVQASGAQADQYIELVGNPLSNERIEQ